MAKLKEDRYGITQFNGLDFDNWKFRMETLLEVHGVLETLYKNLSFETDSVKKKTEYLKNDSKNITFYLGVFWCI